MLGIITSVNISVILLINSEGFKLYLNRFNKLEALAHPAEIKALVGNVPPLVNTRHIQVSFKYSDTEFQNCRHGACRQIHLIVLGQDLCFLVHISDSRPVITVFCVHCCLGFYGLAL